MLSCRDPRELRERLFLLSLDNLFNEVSDSLFDTLIVNSTLAAECSVLPMYYLQASDSSGMKQDRYGNWYKA
jgi:hypothetical protein